jgi:RNA-directed DNA polymerase
MTLASLVSRELLAFGFTANQQKTTILPPGARKILLGVLVDRGSPHLTRAFRNNIETHLFALTNPKIGAMAHRISPHSPDGTVFWGARALNIV